MESLNVLTTRENPVNRVVKNDYFVAIVTLLALAYVGSLSPKLPNQVMEMVDNIVVKFVIFFVIAYFISRKIDVALISSLAVLALLLGLQVYVKDNSTSSKTTMEKMTAGFNNNLQSREAEVTVTKDGNLMENEPLGEKWTQQQGSVVGHTLDWPGYEQVNESVDVNSTASTAPTNATVSTSSEVMAMNETHNVPKNGEVVGVVGTDLSCHAKL
jgi:methyl-accepting chemotaxis protein